jgi:hypothetical protein
MQLLQHRGQQQQQSSSAATLLAAEKTAPERRAAGGMGAGASGERRGAGARDLDALEAGTPAPGARDGQAGAAPGEAAQGAQWLAAAAPAAQAALAQAQAAQAALVQAALAQAKAAHAALTEAAAAAQAAQAASWPAPAAPRDLEAGPGRGAARQMPRDEAERARQRDDDGEILLLRRASAAWQSDDAEAIEDVEREIRVSLVNPPARAAREELESEVLRLRRELDAQRSSLLKHKVASYRADIAVRPDLPAPMTLSAAMA